MEIETNDQTQEMDFGAFDSEMFGEDGNQTDDTEDMKLEDDGEETEHKDESEPETDDSSEDENTKGDGKDPADGKQEPENKDSEQKFTIKVNKEEKEVSLEEMTALAQKGSDYDRVKGQLAQSRQEAESLRSTIGESKELLELLNLVSKESGISAADLVDNLYINMQKTKGVNEATARERLRADRVQRELDAMKAQQQKAATQENGVAERAKRETEEFRSQYPNVELTEELLEKLMPDIQSGMTMVNAYQKVQNADQAAKIAELERKLEAEKQNKRNRSASTGSQSDSGGTKKRDIFDDFASNF